MLFTCVFSLVASSGCSSGHAAAPETEPEPTPSVPSEQIENALKYRVQLQQLQYVDNKCHWLDATSRVALDITVDEQTAWVEDKASGAVPDVSDMFNEARSKAETTTCDDAEAALRFRYTTWQQRVTWALRAQALLDSEGRPSWFAVQSPVLAYRNALDETVNALKEKYEASISAFQPQFETEAILLLSLLCPNAPHKCPLEEAEVDASEPYGKAYANVWIKKAVTFAQALAQDPIKLPPMPGPEKDTAPAS